MHTFISVFLTSKSKTTIIHLAQKNVTLSKDFMHTKSPKASNPLCSIFVTWALEKNKNNIHITI